MDLIMPYLPAIALGVLALLALRFLFGIAKIAVALALLGAALWYVFGA